MERLEIWKVCAENGVRNGHDKMKDRIPKLLQRPQMMERPEKKKKKMTAFRSSCHSNVSVQSLISHKLNKQFKNMHFINH